MSQDSSAVSYQLSDYAAVAARVAFLLALKSGWQDVPDTHNALIWYTLVIAFELAHRTMRPVVIGKWWESLISVAALVCSVPLYAHWPRVASALGTLCLPLLFPETTFALFLGRISPAQAHLLARASYLISFRADPLVPGLFAARAIAARASTDREARDRADADVMMQRLDNVADPNVSGTALLIRAYLLVPHDLAQAHFLCRHVLLARSAKSPSLGMIRFAQRLLCSIASRTGRIDLVALDAARLCDDGVARLYAVASRFFCTPQGAPNLGRRLRPLAGSYRIFRRWLPPLRRRFGFRTRLRAQLLWAYVRSGAWRIAWPLLRACWPTPPPSIAARLAPNSALFGEIRADTPVGYLTRSAAVLEYAAYASTAQFVRAAEDLFLCRPDADLAAAVRTEPMEFAEANEDIWQMLLSSLDDRLRSFPTETWLWERGQSALYDRMLTLIGRSRADSLSNRLTDLAERTRAQTALSGVQEWEVWFDLRARLETLERQHGESAFAEVFPQAFDALTNWAAWLHNGRQMHELAHTVFIFLYRHARFYCDGVNAALAYRNAQI